MRKPNIDSTIEALDRNRHKLSEALCHNTPQPGAEEFKEHLRQLKIDYRCSIAAIIISAISIILLIFGEVMRALK